VPCLWAGGPKAREKNVSAGSKPEAAKETQTTRICSIEGSFTEGGPAFSRIHGTRDRKLSETSRNSSFSDGRKSQKLGEGDRKIIVGSSAKASEKKCPDQTRGDVAAMAEGKPRGGGSFLKGRCQESKRI